MKSVYFLILVALLCTIFSCNNFKSDHPQSEISDAQATDLTSKTVLEYVSQIDKDLSKLVKQTSLVYMLGETSFYVERYQQSQKTILMVEHLFNGGITNSIKKYYFKNDSLILEKSESKLANDDGIIFKDTRTFLRNNTIFKIDNRTASSQGAIHTLPFIDVPLSKNKSADQTILDNVISLAEVIEGKNRFDMVFESITTYPDSRYIILSNKMQNSYTASILVKEKDTFIDSLLNDPITFKNQKLNIHWIVQDHEAIYVPNGLNVH